MRKQSETLQQQLGRALRNSSSFTVQPANAYYLVKYHDEDGTEILIDALDDLAAARERLQDNPRYCIHYTAKGIEWRKYHG